MIFRSFCESCSLLAIRDVLHCLESLEKEKSDRHKSAIVNPVRHRFAWSPRLHVVFEFPPGALRYYCGLEYQLQRPPLSLIRAVVRLTCIIKLVFTCPVVSGWRWGVSRTIDGAMLDNETVLCPLVDVAIFVIVTIVNGYLLRPGSSVRKPWTSVTCVYTVCLRLVTLFRILILVTRSSGS